MAVQRNNIAYVTGTSKGIGKALAEKLLAANYHVFGISRNNVIEHPNFTFIPLDLSHLNDVDAFDFEHTEGNILLVNNAGIIGGIGPVGMQKSQDMIDVMNVNVLAPQILMNKFLNTFIEGENNYHILNISSGAGKSPIDGWAAYCASKASIDLFSETIKSELEIRNVENWSVHSIAPGVVDTAMQEQIRKADPLKFTPVQKFIDFKNNGDLFTPEWVANKLFEVIQNPKKFKKNLQSVREF